VLTLDGEEVFRVAVFIVGNSDHELTARPDVESAEEFCNRVHIGEPPGRLSTGLREIDVDSEFPLGQVVRACLSSPQGAD
jgi:hypothetical protein